MGYRARPRTLASRTNEIPDTAAPCLAHDMVNGVRCSDRLHYNIVHIALVEDPTRGHIQLHDALRLRIAFAAVESHGPLPVEPLTIDTDIVSVFAVCSAGEAPLSTDQTANAAHSAAAVDLLIGTG